MEEPSFSWTNEPIIHIVTINFEHEPKIVVERLTDLGENA